jgi:outer membrane protein assembly factor BamB
VAVAAGAGRVCAVTASQELIALDAATGKEAWRTRLAGPAAADSLRVLGKAVVVCGEKPGRVYRFRSADGRPAGHVQFERADDRITDPPAFQERAGRVCVVLGDRQVRNLQLKAGRALWSAELPFSIGRVAATPDEERVLVFPDQWSFGGKVTCYNAATGRELWSDAPRAKDPAAVHVGSDLVTSIRKGVVADVLVAQRPSDGKVAWSRVLPGAPVFDTVTDAGDRLVVSGGRHGFTERRARAVVVRKRDGAVVGSLSRDGAVYSCVAQVGGTLLVASSRGIEAYRPRDKRAEAVRLARILEDDAAEARAGEGGWLLFRREAYDAARRLLDRALLAAEPDPGAFVRLHGQAAAVRQAAAERSAPTFEAPLFTRPPDVDGRLTEDWRADRAAVLDAPHHVERVQPGEPAAWFWRGPNDLSATLYLGWDAERLYIAVDVRDDVQTTHDFDARQWKGDCLIVGIDPEGDGGYGIRGWDNVFWLALAAKPKQPEDREEDALEGEHSIKIKEDETGTVYELALPWSELHVRFPRAGLRFGLNVMVLDEDGRPDLKAVSWSPGLTQNRNRDIMTRGIAPALFGTVILKGR